MNETLEQEKERLQKRLEQLNVNSVGRERIVQRLGAINKELPDERKGTSERFSRFSPLSTRSTI